MSDDWSRNMSENAANRATENKRSEYFNPTTGGSWQEQMPWIRIEVSNRNYNRVGGVSVAVTGGGLSQMGTTSTSWGTLGQVMLNVPMAGVCEIDLPETEIWELPGVPGMGGTDKNVRKWAKPFIPAARGHTGSTVVFRILRTRSEVPEEDLNGILSPWECFKSFSPGIGYHVLGGTDCAHYVAHKLGITKGGGCIDGYVTHVGTLLANCNQASVIWNEVEEEDVWYIPTDTGGHVGIVSNVVVAQENPRGVSRVTVDMGGRTVEGPEGRKQFPPGGGMRQTTFVPPGVQIPPGTKAFYGEFFRKKG